MEATNVNRTDLLGHHVALDAWLHRERVFSWSLSVGTRQLVDAFHPSISARLARFRLHG